VPKAPAIPVAEPKKEVKAAPIEEVVAIPPPKTLPEIKVPPKAVSLAPKPEKAKPKKSLKKKTQDRQKMIDQALTSVKKKVDKTETDSVTQALDRLKKKVEKTELSGALGGSTGQAAAGGGGSTGAGGARRLEIIDIYKIEIAYQVERNWAFSQQLAGEGQALQVSLIFKVLPSGEITDIRFTENSGNSYLDESAYRAIVKANPVSPHPTGVRTPYVTMGVRFTPEGIRK